VKQNVEKIGYEIFVSKEIILIDKIFKTVNKPCCNSHVANVRFHRIFICNKSSLTLFRL